MGKRKTSCGKSPKPKPFRLSRKPLQALHVFSPNRFGVVVLLAATIMGLLIGVGAAFLWGYLGPGGLIALDPARKAR